MSDIPDSPDSAGYAPPTERPSELISNQQAEACLPLQDFVSNRSHQHLPPYVLFSSGSFSPVTILHTQLMVCIRDYIMHEKNFGDVVGGLLSPVHDSYGKPSLVSGHHRLNMCQLASKHIPWLHATNIEQAQPHWVETKLIMDQVDEIITAKFQSERPDLASPILVLCMGSDLFLGWNKTEWWDPQHLLHFVTKYRVAVVIRDNDGPNVHKLIDSMEILSTHRENIYVCDATFANNISSTLVREQLENDMSIHGLVSQDVEDYIYEQCLYGAKPIDPSATSKLFGQTATTAATTAENVFVSKSEISPSSSVETATITTVYVQKDEQ